MCCWNGFATHFVENGSIVMYVARDGFYKMGAGNFHDQLIPNQPQRRALWNDIEFWEGRSTKWGLQTGVAQPHLPSKPSGYPFYFAHDPAHLVDQIGGMHLLQRCGLIVQLVSPYRCLPAGRAMAMLSRKVASSYNLVQSRAFFQ